MQFLLALIQPPKLQSLLATLESWGPQRLTITETQGYGRQRGQVELYRGHEYQTRLLRKIAIETALNRESMPALVDQIVQVARTGPTGNFGDGKVFLLPCERAIEF
ncbi:MAG: P-II family nitrogen regulator [Pirellulales bacterium]|nr:P-II family nitrogen regulator [Pirellulales bacterium]